jgi:hypothetical protein
MNRRERRAARGGSFDLKGLPESWHCVDCGINTAPGMLNRADMEKAALGEKWDTDEEGITQTFNADTEVFTVRNAVWKAAGMASWGGCLCIRCIEERLGRQLKPNDFLRGHPFNDPRTPGTALRAARLLPPPPSQLIAAWVEEDGP